MSPTESAGPEELLRIGRVVRAHGLKGEVEIRLDWSDSQSLSEARRVLLARTDGAMEQLAIVGRRQTPKGLLLQLEGVSDRDAAEARCGATVSVARSELPPLEDGEYYLCDLPGLEVWGPEGIIGEVREVQMYPSVDAIVIGTARGERFEQPLLDEWLERVDVPGKRITLRSLDGLLEVPLPRDAGAAESEGPSGSPEG